jgi:SAM-dependent methyltransferase
MSEYDEKTYGAKWAPYYDDIYDVIEDSTLDLLIDLAGLPPKALELAVGSGRIAIPLSQRGVAVTGIDISEQMVHLLRGKPGGEAIEIVMGDIADVDLEGVFPLAILAFNTLFTLLTQERQIECFRNVADHLEPGGRFVLDCFVPDLKRFDDHNTRMGVSSISSNEEHAYEMTINDPVMQRNTTHVVRRLVNGETVVLPVETRYAWPSEMDLMARLAGLELENRWGWYDRRPFTEASGQHVSVYRKPS